MLTFERGTAENSDFKDLVVALDADLKKRDGEEHAFYHQFNAVNILQHTVVAYADTRPVACGALKSFGKQAMEVKRMYVLPDARGKGLASQLLSELEQWAANLGVKSCVLETGKRQPEAIGLYRKNGYSIIPNYGQYKDVMNSVCFRKELPKKE